MTHEQRTIVVGVDGSAAGDQALRWAVREAARQHDTVHAITVRHNEELRPGASYPVQPYGRVQVRTERQTKARLHTSVTAALRGVQPAPEVTESVLTGNPAAVLVAATARADLLVVGSHGHSQLLDVLLGSVAAACVRRAHCPVVIAPSAAPRVPKLPRQVSPARTGPRR